MSTRGSRSILAARLSGRGVRLTRQRRILLDVIEHASEHLRASDLLRLAREHDDRIDRATVYRTLSMLKEHGLVEELDLLHMDGSEHHYELKRDRSHVHIVCTGCGRVLEFRTDMVARLEAQIHERTGCNVDSLRIEVSAVCPECATKQ